MSLIAILILTGAVLFFFARWHSGMTDLVSPSAIALAIALPIVATFGMTYLLFAMLVLAMAAMAPGASAAGIVSPAPGDLATRETLFFFALPLLPILTYTIAVGGITLAQVTYVNFISLAGLLALLRANEPLAHATLVPFDRLFLLMLAVSIFMSARGGNFIFGVRIIIVMVLNLGLPYLVASRLVRRTNAPHRLLLALVLAGCILGAIAMVETLRNWLLYEPMLHAVGADFDPISGYTKQRGGLLRARATYGESTGLSVLLGVCAIILLPLRGRIRSGGVTAVAMALLLGGMVCTFARVGYIAIVAGIPAWLIIERRWGLLARAAIALPTAWLSLKALSGVVPILSASLGTGEDAAGSVDYRSMLMDAGLAIVRDNPLTGLPIEDIYAQLDHLRTGEGIIDLVNEPLTIFMRAGIVGGTLYFLPFAYILYRLFTRPGEHRDATAACFAGLTGLMAAMTTTSFGRNEITYVVLLGVGAGLIARQPAPSTAPAIRTVAAR